MSFVHTAVRRNQKPTLSVAQLDYRRVFDALFNIAAVPRTRKVRAKQFNCEARLLETLSIRAENMLKKQDARFSVFFYQSGLMPV